MDKKTGYSTLYLIGGCGVFIVLFLGIFQPFDHQKYSFVSLGFYGLITVTSCTIYYYILPNVTKQKILFCDEKWYQYLHIDIANIATIGTANFLYASLLEHSAQLNWKWFLRYQFYTFSIGTIISIGIYWIVRNIQLKQRLTEVEAVNEMLMHKIAKADENKTLVFESETKNEKVVVQTCDLICVKAEGNYSQFHYTMNGIMHSKLLRMSLKNAEKIVDGNKTFSRSHRSYIVNTDKVRKIQSVGNSYQIWVEGLQEPLPASKQNIDDLKASIV